MTGLVLVRLSVGLPLVTLGVGKTDSYGYELGVTTDYLNFHCCANPIFIPYCVYKSGYLPEIKRILATPLNPRSESRA